MIKIGCTYAPKVTNLPISEYPNYFQVAELGNTFYRLLPQKEISSHAKLPIKNTDFEFILKLNRFITHKYQFRNARLRDEAIETWEKMKSMANELKCNKILIQTHYSLEYDELFFKNLDDFFNSIDYTGFNLFWEFRGVGWKSEKVLPILQKKLTELNIGHATDLLFSKPITFNKEGIIYTRLHGFGAKFDQYLHSTEDLIQLIKEMNTLLENNNAVYVVFPTEEMYNDAIFLKKMWDEIKSNNVSVDKYWPSFDINFLLSYGFTGQNLEIKYSPPFALAPEKDKIKLSATILENMNTKIEEYVELLNQMNSAEKVDKQLEFKYFSELRKLGEYFLKYLLGDKINYRYKLASNQDMILENDEKSLCYPYELIFDKRNFACLRYNLIRKYVEDEKKYPIDIQNLTNKQNIKFLFLDKTQNKEINQMLVDFKPENTETVTISAGGSKDIENELTSGYDIITCIGRFPLEEGLPSLKWGKTPILIDNILKIMKNPPKLFVIGNLHPQSKISYLRDSYSYAIPFSKAGINYLTNFISVSSSQLLEFFTEFYKMLLRGDKIPQALKKTREKLFERYWGLNYSWFSFMLFGDEKFKIEGGV